VGVVRSGFGPNRQWSLRKPQNREVNQIFIRRGPPGFAGRALYLLAKNSSPDVFQHRINVTRIRRVGDDDQIDPTERVVGEVHRQLRLCISQGYVASFHSYSAAAATDCSWRTKASR
jgi:hypothetical protein